MKTQPADAYRAFRGCQRGGARKFSLLMVMCDLLMKMKNRGLLQRLISLGGISPLYCSKEGPRMGSKRYKNIFQEGKNHQHL